MRNAQNEEPLYSLISSFHSHGPASWSDLSGRGHCLRIAPPNLSGPIGLWYHTTVTAQWTITLHQGGLGTLEQRRGQFIYSFILFTRRAASTDIVAINAEVIMR